MGVDGPNNFRRISSWKLEDLYLEHGLTTCKDKEPESQCYLSTATHAIPLGPMEVEIVGLNHIGKYNEQYAFFNLRKEEFGYRMSLVQNISAVKMIFNNITVTSEGSLLCNSTMRYLASDLEIHGKYTIARFCPMS